CGAERPRGHGGDAVGAGGDGARRTHAAAARAGRERDRHARDRIAVLVLHDYRRRDGDGRPHRRLLSVAGVNGDLSGGARRAVGPATAVPTVVVWPSPALIAMDAAAAAVTLTLAVAVTAVTPLSVALIVFVSAFVELSVAVAWPLAPVRLVGWASALFVPLAARVTVTPLTGFPNSSFAVTVIVAALAPVDAVIAPGVAATSDRAALGAPAVPVAV